MNKNLIEFPVSVYGELQPINDVLSKARCRIFYKYGNRNGTYITDEFAEKLISTLHYVPVKGIYDTNDYTDHGEYRDEGKIYGIVPETNNFAWEPHLDDDGVERVYACTDVYIFTALYKEANEIVGKGQSMELYEPTLRYHKAVIGGIPYVVFDDGSFLGLQVLGDDVEPCFEGASFFSLQESIRDTILKIKEYSLNGGNSEMHKLNFKLSDDEKHCAIWELLNPEYNEEGNWSVSYAITAIYDEYAIAFNYETSEYERIYYKKNDETDTVELGEKVKVFIVDVTDDERKVLDTLRTLNGGTYAAVNENLEHAEENINLISELNTKIEESNNANSTLKTENDKFSAQVSELNGQVEEMTGIINTLKQESAELNTELETLRSYKLSIETQRKEFVVSEYTNKLSEELLNSYRENFDKYTPEELDMHLAYELKKASPSAFSLSESAGALPKEDTMTGAERILSKYAKKK